MSSTKPTLRIQTMITATILVLAMSLFGVSAASAAKPSVKISVSKQKNLRKGNSVTFTAKVTAGVTNQKLTLQQKDGKKWKIVATKKLPKKGTTKTVKFKTKLNKTGKKVSYRFSLKKKGKTKKATSKVIKLAVNKAKKQKKPSIRLTVGTSSNFSYSSVVEAKGTVKNGPKKQKVTLQYKLRNAKWKNLKTVKVKGTKVTKKYDFKKVKAIKLNRSAKDKGVPTLKFRVITKASSNYKAAKTKVTTTLPRTTWSGRYWVRDMSKDFTPEYSNTINVFYDADYYYAYSSNGLPDKVYQKFASGSTSGWNLKGKGTTLKFVGYYKPGQEFPDYDWNLGTTGKTRTSANTTLLLKGKIGKYTIGVQLSAKG